jgi:hypothetical protein
VADARIARQVPQRCGTETFDVGMDCVSPVCGDYADKAPFAFTGKLESVTFKFGDFDELNRPGMSGDSTSWEGWSHVRWFVEEVPAGAA